MSFNASISVVLSFEIIIFASQLLQITLSNLPTIILERFNELFSGKCNITVNEDIHNTITPESNKELSEFTKNFRVFATCHPRATSQLSEAVISRFTFIYIGSL